MPALASAAPAERAQTTSVDSGKKAEVNFDALNLNVPIPGLVLAPKVYVDSGFIEVPYLAQYISAIYRYLLGISVIAAAVMIIYGGFRYVMGGVGWDIKYAKEIIQDAVVGLVLLFSIQIVVNTISPDTLSLKPLKVTYIEPNESMLMKLFGSTPSFDGESGASAAPAGDTEMIPPAEGCPKVSPSGASNSWARMWASCTRRDGSIDALKQAVEGWKKAGIDESGSVYVWGGTGGGSKLNFARDGSKETVSFHIGSVNNTTFMTGELRSACGLPQTGEISRQTLAAFVPTGQCATKAAEAYGKYTEAVKCNNMLGADCGYTIAQIYSCAGIRPPQGMDPKAVRGQNGANPSTESFKAGGLVTSPNGKVIYAVTKQDLLQAKSTGQLKFGATIALRCHGHYIMYTGGVGLPYEIMQMGDAGAPKSGQKSAASFTNNGKPNDTRNSAMSVVPTLEAYLKGVSEGCLSQTDKYGPKLSAFWFTNVF